jgi:hypothetical protein
MGLSKKYKFWCHDEDELKYVWSETVPTQCPDNPAHTISSVIVAEIQEHVVFTTPDGAEEKIVTLDSDGEATLGTERLSNNNRVNTYTGDITLDETHQFVLINSNGNVIVTLPSSADKKGKVYNIKKITANGKITIDTTGSETIDGNSEVKFQNRYTSIKVISDGSNWWII